MSIAIPMPHWPKVKILNDFAGKVPATTVEVTKTKSERDAQDGFALGLFNLGSVRPFVNPEA
jgi:hypothetical protein